jgi:hypothetical protein
MLELCFNRTYFVMEKISCSIAWFQIRSYDKENYIELEVNLRDKLVKNSEVVMGIQRVICTTQAIRRTKTVGIVIRKGFNCTLI